MLCPPVDEPKRRVRLFPCETRTRHLDVERHRRFRIVCAGRGQLVLRDVGDGGGRVLDHRPGGRVSEQGLETAARPLHRCQVVEKEKLVVGKERLAPADERLADSDDRLARVHGGEYAIDLRLRDEPLPYDYVILDTAPGKSMLLMAALVAADELIIPVQLTAEGFEGFDAINRSVAIAREMQSIRGEVRLTYRAVLPTFYSEVEVVSQSYLAALQRMHHPDFPGEQLPIAPMPVPETKVFQQAAAIIKHNGERRARTIFDMAPRGDDTPTARGQQAYLALAQMVDAYV